MGRKRRSGFVVVGAVLLALGTASLIWGTETAQGLLPEAGRAEPAAELRENTAAGTGAPEKGAAAARGNETERGDGETDGLPLAGASVATLSRLGSRGDEVRAIQQKLYNWGYLEDKPDGIFGERTRAALIWFQRQNGLVADGIAGPATLAALGIQSVSTGGSASATDNERALLARIISAEARGEPYEGQVAVGAVIMNRVRHPSFPNTLAGVIYQPGAFTAIVDGQFQQPVAESAVRAAADALAGYDPSGGAIYYFNPNTATSAWIWSRPLIKVIGNHRFCS